MSLSKTELRRQLKEARLSLSVAERETKSAAICDRLRDVIDWSAVKTVHCFEPMWELGEVDITSFLDTNKLYTNFVCSRKVNNEWRHVSLDNDGPVPDKFDVIIVPMLGFDPKTLHRIGYGGGYYDKFLATQPQAQKIGVCFEQGGAKNLPVEPHDIPLDQIITELGVVAQSRR